MSESQWDSYTPGSDEEPPRPSDKINDALVEFTGCIGSALPDICSYGLTVGDSYVPFDPDEDEGCEEGEAACSQVWVRVVTISPVSTPSFGNDCSTVMRLTLEVGVLRCFPVIEEGEAPTTSQVLEAATESIDDMNQIYCAAMNCEVWDAITAGDWNPTGPLGGQYGGIWSFTVDL